MTTHISPTDALVWKILKKEGDPVIEGEEIVILESMKMEIPVIAKHRGTVARLLVEEGQAIDEDDPIAEID